mmetsp:Transcript_452/g.1127  ORF Transcript_452/g.1127 Transcript_452/m.1127 type:complete len:106 (-) Transcript_452:106-423(-)
MQRLLHLVLLGLALLTAVPATAVSEGFLAAKSFTGEEGAMEAGSEDAEEYTSTAEDGDEGRINDQADGAADDDEDEPEEIGGHQETASEALEPEDEGEDGADAEA